MRYDELNLRELCPNGIPINNGPGIVKTRALNEFYLRAFAGWYDAASALAVSTQAPYSYEACVACSRDELRRFITEQGIAFYADDAHDIDAAFVLALSTTPFGSVGWVDAITKYACNNHDVTGAPNYDGQPPHHFAIDVRGDVAGSFTTAGVVKRFNENIDQLAPAHVKLNGFNFYDESHTDTFVGGANTGIVTQYPQPLDDTREAWFNADKSSKTLRSSNSVFNINGGFSYAILATDTGYEWLEVVALYTETGDPIPFNPAEVRARIFSVSNRHVLISSTASPQPTAARVVYRYKKLA